MILDPSAPFAVNEIYDKTYRNHAHRGHAEAHRRGIRYVQIAGYYKGKNGWVKKHSDLSDKVTIRDAILQPDGKYVIEDIPCFYPNAVKANMPAFTANDIRQLIRNTNATINTHAGQKPAVLEGHPSPDLGFVGVQNDAHGFGVNWREHPTKPGWAVVDLVDVEPEYVDRIRKKKLTGLSAGLAKDAGGLAKRFGHIALLGSSTQALAHLPTTELFDSGGTINFSADESEFIPTQRKTKMKLEKKMKDCFAAIHTAFGAYEMAEKAESAKEPEFESKLKEAHDGLYNAAKNLHFEMDPGNNPAFTDGPSADTMENSAGATATSGQPMSDVMAKPSGGEFTATDCPEFRADPEMVFAQYASRLQHLQKVADAQELKLKAFENKTKWSEFSTQVESLRKEGRLLPDSTAVKSEFEMCFSHRDPDAALTHRLNAYRAIPSQQTPATVNRGENFFSATTGNAPVVPEKSAKTAPKISDLESIVPDITPADMIWANIGNDTFVASDR